MQERCVGEREDGERDIRKIGNDFLILRKIT